MKMHVVGAHMDPVAKAAISEQDWSTLDQRLRNFIRGRVANPDDVDDILQDSYALMQSRIDQLQDGQRFESWLYTIIRHRIIDFYRKRKLPQNDFDESLLTEDNDVDQGVIQELQPCMLQMLGQLEQQDQDIINAVHLQQQTLQAYADELGISLSAAKSRVQRARKRLRELFECCCSFKYNQQGSLVDVHEHACKHCGPSDAQCSDD